MTLKARIAEWIATEGPMPLDRFMAICLTDPRDGYYTTRLPLGLDGDFITAPEVSQMFGELIGLWLAEEWIGLGRPDPFVLAEFGPGRGTLMADALRATRGIAGFHAAARLWLVEVSPRLKEMQRQALQTFGLDIGWAGTPAGLPDGPLLGVGNEFFDALPIRQFEFDGKAFRERAIGLDANGELVFGLGPVPHDLALNGARPAAGDIVELCLAALDVMAGLATRIAGQGGGFLVLDYGYARPGFGDTFQAVARHRPVDPLALPGEADLTAHVDFSTLAACARTCGATVHGPVTQGEFLLGLGLVERAGRLGAGKDRKSQDAIVAAVERLAGEKEMGRLFKVMAVTGAIGGIDPAPAGFDRS